MAGTGQERKPLEPVAPTTSGTPQPAAPADRDAAARDLATKTSLDNKFHEFRTNHPNELGALVADGVLIAAKDDARDGINLAVKNPPAAKIATEFLQDFLKTEGFLKEGEYTRGDFGAVKGATHTALIEFQKRYGLRVDGKYGTEVMDRVTKMLADRELAKIKEYRESAEYKESRRHSWWYTGPDKAANPHSATFDKEPVKEKSLELNDKEKEALKAVKDNSNENGIPNGSEKESPAVTASKKFLIEFFKRNPEVAKQLEFKPEDLDIEKAQVNERMRQLMDGISGANGDALKKKYGLNPNGGAIDANFVKMMDGLNAEWSVADAREAQRKNLRNNNGLIKPTESNDLVPEVRDTVAAILTAQNRASEIPPKPSDEKLYDPDLKEAVMKVVGIRYLYTADEARSILGGGVVNKGLYEALVRIHGEIEAKKKASIQATTKAEQEQQERARQTQSAVVDQWQTK